MTKLILDGELREDPQFDARGQLFRFELRDLRHGRVHYGTTESDLIATVIAGYPATPRPTIADLAAQFAARRDFAIGAATALQLREISQYEEEHGAGALDLLPGNIARVLRADKRRWSGIRAWPGPVPLYVAESSVLFSRQPRLPRGRVEIIRDLDELSMLQSIAAINDLHLLDRSADADRDGPW
ncbi:hypothetical protein GCM10022286_00260 [Gryllotalpicola daejeonensis]|uniref:Uncharacterized protein n=1 Tax=Gryllotalpicola daejeonensis TaxID=993087 RepID=A0ABP7ZCL2_9MICO